MEVLGRNAQLLGLGLLLGALAGAPVANGRDDDGEAARAARLRLLLAASRGTGLFLLLYGIVMDLLRLGAAWTGSSPLDPEAWSALPMLLGRTGYGRVLIARALLGLAAARAGVGAGRWGVAARVLTAAGLSVAFALGGHAQTGDHPALAVPAQALHTGAAALWFGGLVRLAAWSFAERGPAPALLRAVGRFSRLGLAAMVVLAATGVAVSLTRVFGPRDLVETAYGNRLAVKLLWVAAVLALAAVHRFVLLPALRRGVTARLFAWLRAGLAAEAALGAGVLVAAGALAITPPPLGPAATRVVVLADEYRFQPAEVRVRVGEVARVVLVNRGNVVHDWSVPDLPHRGGSVTGAAITHLHGEGFLHVHVPPGGRATVEFIPLALGRYRVLCTVWPHAERGMLGWLVVE